MLPKNELFSPKDLDEPPQASVQLCHKYCTRTLEKFLNSEHKMNPYAS